MTKREISKTLNCQFKPADYTLTPLKCGKRWYLEFEPYVKDNEGDWQYNLAKNLWVYTQRSTECISGKYNLIYEAYT